MSFSPISAGKAFFKQHVKESRERVCCVARIYRKVKKPYFSKTKESGGKRNCEQRLKNVLLYMYLSISKVTINDISVFSHDGFFSSEIQRRRLEFPFLGTTKFKYRIAIRGQGATAASNKIEKVFVLNSGGVCGVVRQLWAFSERLQFAFYCTYSLCITV